MITPPTLKERIESEAKRRATELADNFDLLEKLGFTRWGFDFETRLVADAYKYPQGTPVRIVIEFGELEAALKSFIEEKVAPIIAQRMTDHILTDPKPDIDVTLLGD